MRLILAGVGRLKAGPERDLLDRYVGRGRALGRGLGITSLDLLEVVEGHERSAEERRHSEAAALAAKLPAGAWLAILDERGVALTSSAFAAHLGSVRDAGASVAVVAVGGPDGFDASMRTRANLVMSFGAATMPHQIVRVLVAEQVYRAMTILARHPYHRD